MCTGTVMSSARTLMACASAGRYSFTDFARNWPTPAVIARLRVAK